MKPSRAVFKCFKWLERQGDRITGAAGPYFVGGAVILIGMGVVCFCEQFNIVSTISSSDIVRSRRDFTVITILACHRTDVHAHCTQPSHALLLRLHSSPRLRR